LGVDFGLLSEVEKINDHQRELFFQKVRSAIWTLRDKRLGVLGLAFKGGTDDIRESPALKIMRSLLDAGASLQAYDPAAMGRAKLKLPAGKTMVYVSNAYQAAEGADALLILTDWDEFRSLDLARVRSALRYPIVVDGRNLFDPGEMHRQGFTYLSMGRPV
jgi:UDPglucose 6-dehydrogenase